MGWSPNVGLADARGIACTLQTLLSQFRALEFADLCAIIEEIVLRERIVVTGQIERFPGALQELLRPFFNERVFYAFGRPHPLVTLEYDENRVRASARVLSLGLSMASPEDAKYEVSRMLGAEQVCGGVSLALLRNLQHFGLMQRPRFENQVWDLAGHYRTMSEIAQQIRDHHQRLARLPVMGIPPIALEVISRCKDIYDLPHQILQKRREFSKLRRLMTELEEKLCSGKLAPADALELERSWRDRWNREIASVEHMARLSFARTSWPLVQNGAPLVRAYTTNDPVPALEVLTKMAMSLPVALGNMQLRPVHRPVANYMHTVDDDLRRPVAKLWKEDLVRIDRDIARLAHERGTPWRLATMSDTPNRAA